MGPVKGFVVGKAFTYDVGAHCHSATGFQFFLPGEVGDFHHLSMDPSTGVAYRIWFLWPWLGFGSGCLGWDFRPGSSSGGGNSLGPSLRVGCGESVGPVVVEIRVLGHSMVSPLTRKRVTPSSNVGSSPSSSSMLNLTCFFSFSSTGVGALLHHALLLASQILDCNFRSLMWRQIHSPAGLELGGLEKGDWDCPWHSGEGLWCHLDLLLFLSQECCFHDPDCPVRESSLGHLAASLPQGSAEVADKL